MHRILEAQQAMDGAILTWMIVISKTLPGRMASEDQVKNTHLRKAMRTNGSQMMTTMTKAAI